MKESKRPSGMIRSMSRRGHVVAFMISVCCVMLILFSWRMEHSEQPFFRFFRMAELSALNARFLARGPLKPSEDVVIVTLDEKTIEKAGTYPIPRGIYGELVDKLTEAGAKVVVFDVLFPDPQNKGELDRLDRAVAEWENTPEPQRGKDAQKIIEQLKQERAAIDEDGKLAAAFTRAMEKGTWVICGITFVRQDAGSAMDTPFKGRALTPEEKIRFHDFCYLQKKPEKKAREELLKVFPPVAATGVLPVIPRLTSTYIGVAYVDITSDIDGVLRYETLVIQYDENYYMPLSVMATWWFLDPDPQRLWLKFSEGVEMAGIDVPADYHNRMLINYCGDTGTFPLYPIWDVIDGTIGPEKFKGKLVFVGATAKGTGDFIVTPYSARLPGVEKHASVCDNILEKRFLQRNVYTFLTDILAIIIIGLAMGVFFPLLSPLAGLVLTIALEAGWLGFAQYSFNVHGQWHNVVYPSLTIFLSFGLITLYRFAFEERRRREVKRVFERYMDPTVVSDMLEDVDKIKLGGDSMAITVLFSDVAGFTRISEKLNSGELINLLNRYFTPLTDIIRKYGGFINKYQGDAILAAFGVPREMPDHAIRACSAAIDCQKKLKELNREFVAAGLPAMPTRIGLSSGPATVGNIGSAEKLEYTVIGDSINLGQRLEAANKEFKTGVIIGERTFDGAREKIVVRDLGLLSVVGRAKPVHAYELLDYAGKLPDDLARLIAVFEKGLACFHQRYWDEAIEKFEEALTVVKDDGPSEKYLELCREYKVNPPMDGWNGCIAMAGK